MGDYHAPQWIDFTETCSPQPPVIDFFETVHAVHERVLCNSVTENAENVQPAEPQISILCDSTKAQEDLNIIKSIPVKMISPKYRNKGTVAEKITYEQVFSDAMKKLELCKKPLRANRDILNKITTQQSFKTPNMPIIKSSRSVGYRSISDKRIQYGQNSAPRAVKVNKNTNIPGRGNSTSANMKKTSVSRFLFKEGKDAKNDTSKRLNEAVDGSNNDETDTEKRKDEDNEKHKEGDNQIYQEKNNDKYNGEEKKISNEEDVNALQDESEDEINDNKNDKKEYSQDNVDAKIEKHNQIQPSKRMTVLTWHNHRRSLHKRGSVPVNNQYVSLAEAVSRFQTETPKRFRTRSTKENHAASTTMNMSKLLQNRLKPTIPISPALVSKNRARAVTVLSQEEREKLQMEELKKHPIKANPIPRSVLRGPRMKVTGVTKKQATVDKTSSSSATQLNEKKCAVNSFQSKKLPLHQVDKTGGPKNTVTKVLVTDPTGIIVEHEEITFFGIPKDTGATKSVTRVVPFSFEARNKDIQMKKEQRLKSLQEASKVKTGFHARPAPNFSKSPTPPAKQQQIAKKPVRALPCPFSFEERDKKLSKRKEQLVKHVFEEDKRARVFRANPAPIFKPVMVRGRSKEHLLIRDKSEKMNEHANKEFEDQENREPDVDSSKIENKYMQKTNSTLFVDKALLIEKQEGSLKALPIQLNTDKRAKERREFDEKMKRKEMEEETKHQEESRNRLEQDKQIKAKLRKMAEIKARPMPIYKPMVIDKATKQLTEPQSPAFASKLRLKQV